MDRAWVLIMLFKAQRSFMNRQAAEEHACMQKVGVRALYPG